MTKPKPKSQNFRIEKTEDGHYEVIWNNKLYYDQCPWCIQSFGSVKSAEHWAMMVERALPKVKSVITKEEKQ